MEGISRKDLDRISQILSNHVNTDESIKLATMLTKADVIPKLYVYTYFNKVYQELKTIRDDDGKFEMDAVEELIENFSGLELYFIQSKPQINNIFQFLSNGFKRLNQFCDFDDSRFTKETKMCKCQNEDHEGENLVTKCSPWYYSDEYTKKWNDVPIWTCKNCDDVTDVSDCEFDVSCDMEMGD